MTAKAIEHKHADGEKDLFSQIGYLKYICYGFDYPFQLGTALDDLDFAALLFDFFDSRFAG